MVKTSKVKTRTGRIRGPQGKRGERGEQGERGEPGITHDALERLIGTVEALRAESDIQLRRIADLQAQLDITLAQFQALRQAGRPITSKPRVQKRN
jgi:hypothetical protein